MPITLDSPVNEMAKESTKTRTIRMHDDLVKMLKVIEAAHEITGDRFKPVEYLDKLTRRAIVTEYEKARATIAKAGRE